LSAAKKSPLKEKTENFIENFASDYNFSKTLVKKAIELHENLTKNVNSVFIHKTKEFNKQIIKPNFL
jgi:hypothetical protein